MNMETLTPMKALSDTGFAEHSLISAIDLDKIKQAMIKFARAYATAYVHTGLSLLEFEQEYYGGLETKFEENGNT